MTVQEMQVVYNDIVAAEMLINESFRTLEKCWSGHDAVAYNRLGALEGLLHAAKLAMSMAESSAKVRLEGMKVEANCTDTME